MGFIMLFIGCMYIIEIYMILSHIEQAFLEQNILEVTE